MGKLIKIKPVFLIFFLLLNVLIGISFLSIENYETIENNDNSEESKIFPINLINTAQGYQQDQVLGTINNREGKIFTNITNTNQFCYINRDNPGLDTQPTLFLQNWNITRARMRFENLTALNYTKDIETQPTEFIISYSETDPIYVYQKFAVETDQYVNNISIFIQDVIDEDLYTDENSWEVSIVNCSNDSDGTPNSFETLKTLKKPHPNNVVAHWEVFDFKNSDLGSIYLNTSNTKWNFVNGIKKYWFAIKIKIPPDDSRTGGGPKFLYLNPDGSDPNNIGEGETFAQSPQFINLTYNLEDVADYRIDNGSLLTGSLDSFKFFDEDRFTVENGSNNRILLYVKIDIDNLTNARYTWEDLKDIRNEKPYEWTNILNSIVFSFNFSLVINVSSQIPIAFSGLYWLSQSSDFSLPKLDPLYPSELNLTSQREFLQTIYITDPWEKLSVIQHMNTSVGGNNSIIFACVYLGWGLLDFNVSINQLNLEVGEIVPIQSIQKYDPIVHDLHYCTNVTLSNSTFYTPSEDILDSIKENDNDFLEVIGDSTSNTTIVEFEFNVLESLNSSLWDVDDPIEWIFNLPNPRIFQIDFRISSNVSIEEPMNLTLAVLEIYNGGDFAPFTDLDWLLFSDNKTFADKTEHTKILPFDSYYSWFVMHLLNETDNHSLKVRLRFVGNGTFQGINVSIDEFTLNFHIQNAFSSDVASKIGFGLDSSQLNPSDIQLENFGMPILDNGIWEMNISDGEPLQGFYSFDVTSIWPEVQFDVIGNYSIENYQILDWEYILDYNQPNILWNVTADISYYSYYERIEESQCLEFKVPINWELINVLNFSSVPPASSGGWYWSIQSIEQFNYITVFNISDGIWKIGMNSSMSGISIVYNAMGEIKIDQLMVVNATILSHYGGELNFEVYSEALTMIYSDNVILNETALENSSLFEWDVLDTTLATGIYYLKTYWISYNQTHAFLAIDVNQINVSKWNSDFTYDSLPEIIRFGQEISLDLDFTCENSSISFEGFPVHFTIEYETLSQPFTRYIDSNYETSLNYTIPNSFDGNLTITIEFDGDYRIWSHIEVISLDIEEKLRVNIEFVEIPNVQYLKGTHYFSVIVRDELGTPLESYKIIFRVLDGQNNEVYTIETRSNEEGLASASIVFQNLGTGFSIEAAFEEEGIYASNSTISNKFRVVDEFTLFIESFLQYLPYILLGIVVISTLITVRYFIKSKQRRVWAEEAMILDDLVKTTYIMIIHKDVGVSIYDKQISLELDVDLISGFLQAISAFRSEIKRDNKASNITIKSEGFEMDYYDFKIVITDGEHIRVALILEGKPSEELKENQRSFTEHFEKRYESNLKNFTGDITPFMNADDLIEKHFNVTLIYPLQLGTHYGVVKLKGLEKALIEVAEQIQKERKFFFVSSLLNFGLAGRKASRDEIISTIINLKKKGTYNPGRNRIIFFYLF